MRIDFLKPFQKKILGVDIGTVSIKAVEIEKLKTPRLVNYGILKITDYLKRSNSALQTPALKLSEKETTELLIELIKTSNFQTNEAVASLPLFSVFSTLLKLPKMSSGELAQAMSFQIKQHIPLPESEVSIDWLKIGEIKDSEGEKEEVLLMAIPNELIEKYKNIFKKAGLILRAIEVETLPILRIVNKPLSVILDIGAFVSNLIIKEESSLKNQKHIEYGGISLTKAVSRGLNIDPLRAEEMKIQKGLVSEEYYELSTLMTPFIDVIIKEIEQLRKNFELNYNKEIKTIVISGGGANLLGLKNYIFRKTGMETEVVNPFKNIEYPQEIIPLINILSPNLANAIGLSLKK